MAKKPAINNQLQLRIGQ